MKHTKRLLGTLIGGTVAIIAFCIFYSADFRKYNVAIDRLFYRSYTVRAGVYRQVEGQFRDTTSGGVFGRKAICYKTSEPQFTVLTLMRNQEGFAITKTIMSMVIYPFKQRKISNNDIIPQYNAIRPNNVINPNEIFRYAYVRMLLLQNGVFNNQAAYSSIEQFPTTQSVFFRLEEVSDLPQFNSFNGVPKQGNVYFGYAQGVNCSLPTSLQAFRIERKYGTLVLYLCVFLVVGSVIGLLTSRVF